MECVDVNTLIGVPLISLLITYKEARYFIENFDPSHMSQILATLIACGVFILYYIFFQIIVEMTCMVWIVVIYNYIKQAMIKTCCINDWDILKWIVSDQYILRRLCLVNGLLMDEYYEYHKKHGDIEILNTRNYIINKCKNNFIDADISGLKELRNIKRFRQVLKNIFFENEEKYKHKLLIGVVFMLSRFVRFFVIPLIAAIIIIPNINKEGVYWRVILWVMFMMEICFIIWVMVIFKKFGSEIYYSLYLMGDRYEIGDILRQNVGWYYKSVSVYELKEILEGYVGPDLNEIIASYLVSCNNDNDDINNSNSWNRKAMML